MNLKLSRLHFLFLIIAIILLSGGWVIANSLFPEQHCQCSHGYVAAHAFKYNISVQNQSEQKILITYLGGMDSQDLANLTVFLNDEIQPVLLGITPRSYVVISGTPGQDHVIVTGHFNTYGDVVNLDMILTESASVQKHANNITVTYLLGTESPTSLSLSVNDVHQPDKLMTSLGSNVTIPGTFGTDHIIVYKDLGTASDQEKVNQQKLIYIDAFV